MTIQEVFAKAENGTLTFEQFQALVGDAKFVDLTEGHYVSKQKYDNDVQQRDTQISTLNQTLESRKQDLTQLQTTLNDAGDIEAMKQAVTDLEELRKTYDKETKQYQRQLKDQAYDFAVRNFAHDLKFTSPAAERDFISQMKARNLTMENDTIIGASDFLAAYKQDNAESFVADTQPQTNPVPTFVQPTSNPTPPSPTLTQMMQWANEHPDQQFNF